jgi:hypothetical protein
VVAESVPNQARSDAACTATARAPRAIGQSGQKTVIGSAPTTKGVSRALCGEGAPRERSARPGHTRRPTQILGHIGDIFARTTEAEERKCVVFQELLDAGGGTRTPDTRIMIPLL